MPTDEQIFEWLDSLCEQAKSDVTFLNRLAVNSAFTYYFNNVYTLKAMSPKTFAAMAQMTEVRRWYTENAEAEERRVAESARDEKIAALQAELSGLSTMFKSFMESQKPAEPVKKNGKGKAAKDEADEEAEE